MALSQKKQASVDRRKRESHVAGYESYPEHWAQVAITNYLATGEVNDDLPHAVLERIYRSQDHS